MLRYVLCDRLIVRLLHQPLDPSAKPWILFCEPDSKLDLAGKIWRKWAIGDAVTAGKKLFTCQFIVQPLEHRRDRIEGGGDGRTIPIFRVDAAGHAGEHFHRRIEMIVAKVVEAARVRTQAEFPTA